MPPAESARMNNLTALTSAAEAPYFARTWSNERGAATDFAVIRKAFFIRSVILACRARSSRASRPPWWISLVVQTSLSDIWAGADHPKRAPKMVYMKVGAPSDVARADPRFQALLRQMNVPK